MRLSCPNCQTAYRIDDDRIPVQGARATCPNCGQIILIAGTGTRESPVETLSGESGTDFGQTMAYDYSQVDQSQSEVSSLLQKISGSRPFIAEGLVLSLRDVRTKEEYILTRAEITVGRSGTDIKVDDPEVSRRHCLIKVFGDRMAVIDLESTNGTFVRGSKVMTANLGISEEFTIGNTTLVLVASEGGQGTG